MQSVTEKPLPRVLFMNRSYWPDAEATGQLLTELCEDLTAEFDVSVIAGQPNQNPNGMSFRSRGTEVRNGVRIHRVWNSRFSKASLLGKALNFISYLGNASLRAMFTRRPDLVVVQTDPPLLCLLGMFLQWWRQVKLVVYMQDLYPDLAIALGKIPEGKLSRALGRIMFTAYRRADHVVVLSHDMKKVLTRAGIAAEKISCISNWTDTSQVVPARPALRFRAEHGVEDRFVVMYSGNMGLCQCLEDVVEAAALLKDDPSIAFLLIGDGAKKPQLEQLVAKHNLRNLRFLPYQPKSQLSESLSAADLHLLPVDPRIIDYLMPSKLYGILASGSPVLAVVPEGSELANTVRDLGAGLVVPPGRPKTIAEAIRWAAAHPKRLTRMGRLARKAAVTLYDRKVSTGAFHGMLCGALGKTLESEVPVALQPPVASVKEAEPSHRTRVATRPMAQVSLVVGTGIYLATAIRKALSRGQTVVDGPHATIDFEQGRMAIRDVLRTARPERLFLVPRPTRTPGQPSRLAWDVLSILRWLEEARVADVRQAVVVLPCYSPAMAGRPGETRLQGFADDSHDTSRLLSHILREMTVASPGTADFRGQVALVENLYGPQDGGLACSGCSVIGTLIRATLEARDTRRVHFQMPWPANMAAGFAFVHDAARALVRHTDLLGEPVSSVVRSMKSVEVRQLGDWVCEFCGYRGAIHWQDPSNLVAENASWPENVITLESALPTRTALRDGLIRTIAWYERHSRQPRRLADYRQLAPRAGL